jgi:transcription termination factor NusA
VNDLADLATDELIEMTDIDEALATSLITQARAFWDQE